MSRIRVRLAPLDARPSAPGQPCRALTVLIRSGTTGGPRSMCARLVVMDTKTTAAAADHATARTSSCVTGLLRQRGARRWHEEPLQIVPGVVPSFLNDVSESSQRHVGPYQQCVRRCRCHVI